MAKSKNNIDGGANDTRPKWMPPEGYICLTDEEQLEQQRWIRDKANEMLCQALEDGKPKNGWTAQEMANKAAAMVAVLEAKLGPADNDGKIIIEFDGPEIHPDHKGTVCA